MREEIEELAEMGPLPSSEVALRMLLVELLSPENGPLSPSSEPFDPLPLNLTRYF
jgi:hypothetical protein